MKITEVETFVVGNPPPGWGGRYFIFVKLVTDGGVVGYGEAYNATVGPTVMADYITDIAERHLIGHDPFHIERFWHRAYGAGYSSRPDISLMGAVSALEVACWDIVGKETNKPVYELLGGRVHDSLRSYTYLYPHDDDQTDVYLDPDLAAQRALDEVERGFTAIKFDPAGPYTVYDGHQPSLERLELSEAFCRRIREAVGTRADLLFGTHGQFTASGAIRLARRLEAYDPLWFEEPVPPGNPEAMATVARQTTIPIAAGERLTTKTEFARLLEAGAAAILQLNLGRCGGILEGRKIGALAEAAGAQLAPHLYNGPITAAANIALATCSPNFLILEAIQDFGGFHAELLVEGIRWEDGHVIPSTEPGLGVTLDEAVARAHPYEGDELHLLPQMEPFAPGD